MKYLKPLNLWISQQLSQAEKIFFQRSHSTRLQIDSLDGVRGVAVLFVILGHMGLHRVPFFDLRGGAGHYGVYLFFVLSAFLLTLPILNRPMNQFLDIGLWVKYAARRFLRIFPPYIAVLFINYACTSLLGLPHFFPLSFREVLSHISLRIGYNVFWTIPIEVKYYFVLPIFAFLLVVVSRKRIFVVPFFIVSLFCIIAVIRWPPYEVHANWVNLRPYLPIFLMGSFAALLHVELEKIGRLKSAYSRILLEGLAVIAFLFIIILIPHHWSVWAGRYAQAFRPSRDFLLIGFLWSLFIFLYLNGVGIIRRFLEIKFLRFTGIVSFSAYLWHVPIIGFIKANVTVPIAGKLLMIPAVLLIAALSHVLIERPFMRLDLQKYLFKAGLSPSPTQ